MNKILTGKELAKLISESSLSEIVDLCDEIAKLYGFKGSQDLLASLAPNGSSDSEEETQEESAQSKICDVFLCGKKEGATSIPIVRAMKALLENGIGECKAMFDACIEHKQPVKLKSGLLHTDADALIKEWSELGAILEKKPSESKS